MDATATEVVIALQFAAPIASLNALAIAEIAASFPELPVFSEQPIAGPMPYTLGQLEGSEPLDAFVANFQRIALAPPSGNRSLTFQADRLTYSWVRTTEIGEPDDYPGFDELVAEFDRYMVKFAEWMVNHGLLNFAFKVAEITYVNIVPTRKPDGDRIRLSQLFTFLRAAEGSPGVNGYYHAWNERLNVADGVLRVLVNGPVIYAPESPAASFSLVAGFRISDTTKIIDELLTVRQRVRETYERVLVSRSTT